MIIRSDNGAYGVEINGEMAQKVSDNPGEWQEMKLRPGQEMVLVGPATTQHVYVADNYDWQNLSVKVIDNYVAHMILGNNMIFGAMALALCLLVWAMMTGDLNKTVDAVIDIPGNVTALYEVNKARAELALLGDTETEETDVEVEHGEPKVSSDLPHYNEESKRLGEFIKENEPADIEIDFASSPLKGMMSRLIKIHALRFIVEMYEKSDMRSFEGAVETYKNVSKVLDGGDVKVYFAYTEKDLVLGENWIVYEPRYLYYSGYQFIQFTDSDWRGKDMQEVYKAFFAEYQPPMVEVKLPGKLVSKTSVTELWTQDAMCSYPFDAEVSVWDWK